jgi:hypothetical protein
MNGFTDLFGDWVAKGVIWALAALVIQVLAIHWGARLSGLHGSLGRAVVAFLMILVTAGVGRVALFALMLVLPIAGFVVLTLQLLLAVGVQTLAMLLLYRAGTSRALLASFLTSFLGVALLTPVTLLLV